MNIVFTPTAWEQYTEWQREDKKMVRRINELIKTGLANKTNPVCRIRYRGMHGKCPACTSSYFCLLEVFPKTRHCQ